MISTIPTHQWTVSADTGGQVIKTHMEVDCEMTSSKMLNFPYCLHATCDVNAYLQLQEDISLSEMDKDMLEYCDFEIYLSGAAIHNTRIISIALVSLL